ncbi:hypothetical protein G6F58_012055 [Rhizopus delemar]|nr:hypothetical protein G6F58_012055 [Rhizopus delemar]
MSTYFHLSVHRLLLIHLLTICLLFLLVHLSWFVSSGAAALTSSLTHSTHSIFSPATLTLLIDQLSIRKAPGADHLKAEILKPISTDLSHLLSWFFSLCSQWSYVPSLWRHAQAYPIFKKVLLHGSPRCRLNLIWFRVAFVLVTQLLIKPYVFMS